MSRDSMSFEFLRFFLPTAAAAAAVLLSAAPARAHIELMEPAARYGRDQIKSCPCGAGGSNRTCDVEADGSDPNRSDNVTTFEVGSTITVRLVEFIDHGGRYRVAFDPDGADVEDFNANILLDEPDPSNVTSNTDEPDTWEFEVQLPDTPCENCTLQVVQAMHGDEVNPVPDPSGLSSYYSCADIRLVPVGSLEAGGDDLGMGGSTMAGDSAGTGGDGMGGDGMGGSGMAGDGMGGDGMGGDGMGAFGMDGQVVLDDDEGDDDGGCSFAPAAASGFGASGLAALLGLALAGLRRRRR